MSSGGGDAVRRLGPRGDHAELVEEGFVSPPVDVDLPRWDQRTFVGRLNHFARVTNPRLLFKAGELDSAARLVNMAREGRVPRGTTAEQLYSAKVLYDSAFHPDSGEKMNVIGRMSTQLPASTVIVTVLMTFYKSTFQVFAAQWFNQSFNALVNYTNRNAKSQVTNSQIGFAYVGATAGAVGVSVAFNHMLKIMKSTRPLLPKLVPFVAVATANCINIPFMRQRELVEGVVVTDKEGNTLGKSRLAAAKGISLVCLSRIFIVAPSMILGPLLVTALQRNPSVKRGMMFAVAVNALVTAVTFISLYRREWSGNITRYTFTVPTGCALFPQQCSMQTSRLEASLQREIHSGRDIVPERVYFNKGL